MARFRPSAGQFVAGAIFRLFDSDQKTFPADAVSECICRLLQNRKLSKHYHYLFRYRARAVADDPNDASASI
jgi:hypothetical protein